MTFAKALGGALTGLVLMLAGAVAGPALAQQYPDRPIRLVVPFPPGGGGDSLARTVMAKVSESLGQNIVIDNRPGAGGNVGSEIVARSAPDGYTLLYGTNGTHAINKTLYKKIGFDPARDFAPISRLSEIALILVAGPSLPATSAQDLVRQIKAEPGKFNFGSAGNGTSSHLAGELFKSITGTDTVHVPYQGGAQAMLDLLGGRVSMMIEVMPNAYPQVQAGKIRGLAVTTPKRVAMAPEVPTFSEAGIAGMELTAWDGIFAPAGTPQPVIERVNAAIHAALADPQVKSALLNRGAEAVPSTPDELARHVATEIEKWAKVVRQSGAQVD